MNALLVCEQEEYTDKGKALNLIVEVSGLFWGLRMG